MSAIMDQHHANSPLNSTKLAGDLSPLGRPSLFCKIHAMPPKQQVPSPWVGVGMILASRRYVRVIMQDLCQTPPRHRPGNGTFLAPSQGA